MEYMETREVMCDICHKMWQLGWVAANDGNLSVKLPDGNFLATPTGISKSFITPEKLVIINPEGEVLQAIDGYRPSSEIKMHLRCYKERDDVGAVLHAHPPTATGYAVAHIPLDRYTMIETTGDRLNPRNTVRYAVYIRGAGCHCPVSSRARRIASCKSRRAYGRCRRNNRILPYGNT